jgi:hypothetical protein
MPTMSWTREWLALLQNKAHAQLQSYPMDFDLEVYDELRMYCIETDIIYFPAMYDEYMEYIGNRCCSSAAVREYAAHSKLVQQQLQELADIRRFERFAKAKRIRFYKGDGLIEKIALTAHYMRMR